MTAILNLPPEIIHLIVLHIVSRDIDQTSSLNSVSKHICLCADDAGSVQESLTEAGQGHSGCGQDLFHFAISHSYFRDCVGKSGYLSRLYLWRTAEGILRTRSHVITAAVRTANVAFKWSSSENRPTLSQPRQLPHDSLFNQLQCYPELESLHLDFVSCPMHHKGRQLAALTFQQPTCPAEERTRNGIRELCIRLPRTCIRETEAHNSELLTIILRPLNSTNLRKLHLNISVFEDWWDGHDSRGNRITAENPIFEWLNPLTRTWPSLELLKLCVYVEPLLRTEYLTNWDLWQDALQKLCETIGKTTLCKIELCIVYAARDKNRGLPLASFQQHRHGEWVLKKNLAPVDMNSVMQAIERIRGASKSPVPSFDLDVKFCDLLSARKMPVDLVKMKYRVDQKDAKDLRDGESELSGWLEGEFDVRSLTELHRYAWICEQDEEALTGTSEEQRRRLQDLQQEYERSFARSEYGISNVRYEVVSL